MKNYQYLLIGGGIASDSAARAIRELDPNGTIGLIGAEPDPPYNRPPLSKSLWKDMPFERIWRHTADLNVELNLGRSAQSVDPAARLVTDSAGEIYAYTKLLIATGGSPIRLPGSSQKIIYYRDLADYRRLRELCQTAQHFAVIGGGFIGSELAAVLATQGKQVSLLFLEEHIGSRLFPADLAGWLDQHYRAQGVNVLPGRRVTQITEEGEELQVQTLENDLLRVDGILAGLGLRPNLDLAHAAGLEMEDGIRVDASMRTSDAHIYAAGDVVSFPSSIFGRHMRVEHEEHANLSGRIAGLNMAGAQAAYDHLPAFYSSIFEINYDAVGELDPSLQIVADWIEPYRQGVLYYLNAGRVRGILLWNVPSRLEAARALIAQPGPFTAADLNGKIRPPVPPQTARRILRISGQSGETGSTRH